MTPIAVRLTAAELAEIDRAIEAGRYRSRSDVIRTGVKLALAADREAAIVASYRDGYGHHPQMPGTAEEVAQAWAHLDDDGSDL
jgi:Arc/MetJ-type ribon-helix-helix transcriptional regulator